MYGHSKIKKPNKYSYSGVEEPYEYKYFRTEEPHKYRYLIMKELDGVICTRLSLRFLVIVDKLLQV